MLLVMMQSPFYYFKIDVWIEPMEEKGKAIFCKACHWHIIFDFPHDKGLIAWSDARYKYLWKIKVLKSISNWVDNVQICTSKHNIKHACRNYTQEYLGSYSQK